MAEEDRKSVREERSETTRNQILEAGLKCFAEHGFDKSSTQAIAKEAGVSQGIIFHYFKTKEGLFSAIVKKGIEGFDACVERTENSGLPPREKILLLMRAMGEMSLADPARTGIIIRQLFQMTLDAEKVEFLGIARVIATIRDAFEEGKKSAAFREDLDTESAALSVLGIYVAQLFWSTMVKRDDFVSALERACDLFFDGITRR
ncbi:MAG: TetR/AcrR family transcriptional regulator [Myxococcales bacterium]